ncbi:hypothetical protein D3C71_2082830 [compost metagenome]
MHQRPAGRDVVGINQRLSAKRAFNESILADEPFGERSGDISGLQAVLKLLQWSRLGRGPDRGRGGKRSHVMFVPK